MKQKLFRSLFLSVMAGAALASCSDEETSGITVAPTDGDCTVTLVMDVPVSSSPATRALREEQESQVHTLNVLVFEVDGSNETFLYATHGMDFSNESSGTDDGGGKGTCTVKLLRSVDKPHRLVFLPNLADEVEAAYQSGKLAVGRTKDDVLADITFIASGVWDTTSDPPRYLPMWGQSDPLNITPSLGKFNVKLLRSVARIDVVLNPDNVTGDGQGFGPDFSLENVIVRNAASLGLAAPDHGNLTGLKADLPTPAPGAAASRIVYPTDPVDGTDQTGLVRGIYIAESNNNSTGILHEEKTCIILEGKYRNDTKNTFYRIDLLSFTPPPPRKSWYPA